MFNCRRVYFVWPLEYLNKKYPVPTKRTTFLLSDHAGHCCVCSWCVFVTKISSEVPVINIRHQSAGQSVPPWAMIWGSAGIFRRESASRQVWETVAWRKSENYCEVTIKRKFVLMSNWVSADVLQQSLEETFDHCCPHLPLPQHKPCTPTARIGSVNNNSYFEDGKKDAVDILKWLLS